MSENTLTLIAPYSVVLHTASIFSTLLLTAIGETKCCSVTYLACT